MYIYHRGSARGETFILPNSPSPSAAGCPAQIRGTRNMNRPLRPWINATRECCMNCTSATSSGRMRSSNCDSTFCALTSLASSERPSLAPSSCPPLCALIQRPISAGGAQLLCRHRGSQYSCPVAITQPAGDLTHGLSPLQLSAPRPERPPSRLSVFSSARPMFHATATFRSSSGTDGTA